ncbi:MAG: hypothetical protein Q9157_003670 [Trypethelium eluteriae]
MVVRMKAMRTRLVHRSVISIQVSSPYPLALSQWSPDYATALSNWVALEYCGAFAPNTWACHAPESCGKYCPSSVPWNPSLETLTANGCSDMKSDARVALYAPSTIDHILSLPSSVGGSTGYYPPGSTTVVDGYTPSAIQPLTTYATTVPTTPVLIAPSAGSETLVSTLSVQANSLAASTTASSPTSSSLPTPIPSSGLTTGSKAGIGVGVAGGVVLIAVAIISFLNFRKRRRQRLSQQPPHMQYPQQPPMQGAPYYDPQEKSTWRGTYAPPGVHQPPTAYSEAAAYPPQQKAVPVELSSEQRPTELESMSAVNLDPAPSYSDPRASSENAQRFISRTPMD